MGATSELSLVFQTVIKVKPFRKEVSEISGHGVNSLELF